MDLPAQTRRALGYTTVKESNRKPRKKKCTSTAAEEPSVEADMALDNFDDLDSEALLDKQLASSQIPDDELELSEEQIARLRPQSASGQEAKPLDPWLANHTVSLADVLPNLPQKGSFDVRRVGESSYFFS